MTKSYSSRLTVVLLILLILITISAYGILIALADLTMVSLGWVLTCTIPVAAVVAIAWRGGFSVLFGIDNAIVNKLISVVVFTGVITAGFYGINFWMAKESTAHQERAVVIGKHRETRHRTRRVGRRYLPGEAYYIYYIDLQYPDGEVKPRQVKIGRFNHTRTGDTISVGIEMGALGFPVIK
ncbi:MAG: hypothetical protein HDS75_00630 [Bacteroidales bacterium]|nr:hypothetical protein [Bacteroidales bacterium]